MESEKVVDAVASLNRLSLWQVVLKHPTIFVAITYTAMLGRRVEGRSGLASVRLLGRIVSMLRKINEACYRIIFTRNGLILVTHPFWLLRRGMLDGIERCIGRGDRDIVIIGPDPGLAWEVARSHPDSTVQSFAAGAQPDEELVRRENSASIDLLIAVDLPDPGVDAPVLQWIGQRRVLLRISGDQRATARNYTDIVYFGGPGTRFCYAVWSWGRYVLIAGKPRSLVAQISLRAIRLPLAPIMYATTAPVGVAMNVIGLILDLVARKESPLRPDEGRDEKSVSPESSI
jgi:hypothetical protein